VAGADGALGIPAAAALTTLLQTAPDDLAGAALLVATVEFPDLDPAASVAEIAALSARAAARLAPFSDRPVRDRLAILNRFVYEEEGFRANRRQYDDFRNSLLNVVIERRLGIPLSLAVVYMTVARQAGIEVNGVCFPGHFLMRAERASAAGPGQALILDPFENGRELNEADCRALLARHADDAAFSPALLRPCSPRRMVVRMLTNLKRTYITLRSFPQAWRATELLLALEPTLDADLRDRGLLAYHLQDYPRALRDLELYLRRSDAHEDTEERTRIWDHVTGLRRKVAGRN
jgi:regulator of sirC expression with transglutaminase-like and TPR domain